ncbi:MAG: hypothetical protein ACI90V_011032, partial [Bacillariaceae sp.]
GHKIIPASARNSIIRFVIAGKQATAVASSPTIIVDNQAWIRGNIC